MSFSLYKWISILITALVSNTFFKTLFLISSISQVTFSETSLDAFLDATPLSLTRMNKYSLQIANLKEEFLINFSHRA